MKRFFSALLMSAVILVSFSGCSVFDTSKNSISKTSNTVATIYTALKENLELRGKKNYSLYGVKMTVNSENVGKYTYVYTNKRPDEMKYSDVLIVEVNNRTGRIEKCSAPDYAKYSTMPYDIIKSNMPIVPDSLYIDSDKAVSIAANAASRDDFVYNYVDLTLKYTDGRVLYNIGHISLVNNCIYKCTVDAMTGSITDIYTEDLQ